MSDEYATSTRDLSRNRHLCLVRLVISLLLLAAVIAPLSGFAQQASSRRVLIIYDQSDLLPYIARFDDAIRATLDQSPGATYYSREFLDNDVNGDPANVQRFQDDFRRWITRKYASAGIDLVIAFGAIPSNPLPGVPTIYVGQPPALGGGAAGAFIPILSGDEVTKTVELALRLNPSAKNLVLMTGAAEQDRAFAQFVRQQIAHYADKLNIQDLSHQTILEMGQTLSTLPKDSIVVMLSVRADSSGKRFNGPALIDFLSPMSNVPIYSVVDGFLGHGVVGGYSINFERLGRTVGQTGEAIFAGRSAQSIKLPPASGHEWMFDVRQLKRWSIRDSDLPPSSHILYREPSLWSRYRWAIISILFALLLQTSLIGALWINRRRLRASRSQLESRLRFEKLMSDLSGIFLEPKGDTNVELSSALKRILTFFEVERVSVFSLDETTKSTLVCAEDVPGLSYQGACEFRWEQFSWSEKQLRSKNLISFSTVGELPAEAEGERKIFPERGVRSGASVPLEAGGKLIGVMFFLTFSYERKWDETTLPQLRLVAQVFANALEQKRYENALVESESRFQQLANTLPVIIWAARQDGFCLFLNETWRRFSGKSPKDGLGYGWLEDVHEDDRNDVTDQSAAFAAGLEFAREVRARRYDGESRWVLILGVPVQGERRFAAFIGCAIDITERRQAENSAEKLAQQLLQSQEDERRKIARELHDGSAQDVFAIKLQATRMKTQLGGAAGLSPEDFDDLLLTIQSALRNLRSMSYLLHPPLLESGGLIPAVKWFVDGFKKRSEMNVVLQLDETLPRLSEAAETALFRVIQESLSNALRHSGSGDAAVRISAEENRLVLEIRDYGQGFVPDKTSDAASSGVGLASMRERLRELGGNLTILSSTNGTTIRASVPLSLVAAAAAN